MGNNVALFFLLLHMVSALRKHISRHTTQRQDKGHTSHQHKNDINTQDKRDIPIYTHNYIHIHATYSYTYL